MKNTEVSNVNIIDVLQARLSATGPTQAPGERIIHHLDNLIIERITYRSEGQASHKIIVHSSNSMTVTTQKGELEAFEAREDQYRILDTICSVFFNEKAKDKDRQAFLEFLNLFAVTSHSQDEKLECYSVFNSLKAYNEGAVTHEGIVYRNYQNTEVQKRTIFHVMGELHECFTVFRELSKLPSAQIKKLISPAKVIYFAVLSWKMMKWKVYNFWHDHYFYLFSKWESNPDRFEDMYLTLYQPAADTNLSRAEQDPSLNETVSFTDRDLIIDFNEEERNEASWHS
ncbi:hypothetical protein ACQ0QQ_02065 [Lysinibacillus sphaericus]